MESRNLQTTNKFERDKNNKSNKIKRDQTK